MKTIKRIIVGLFVLLALLVAGVSYFLFSTDFNAYKPEIAEFVKEYTGRDLVIAGDITPSISLFPTLEVSNVSFSNAKWSKHKEMVTVGRFKIEVALMPLFRGEFGIDNIEIDNAVIVLETSADGANNMEFDVPSSSKKSEKSEGDVAIIPDFGRISINNLKLLMIKGKETQTVGVSKFSLVKRFGGDNDIRFKAIYNEQPMELVAKISAIKDIVKNGDIDIDKLNLKLAGLGSIEIEGEVEEIYSDNPDIELDFEIEGDEKYTKPYTISAELNNKGGVYTLSDVELEAGDSNAKGSVVVDISKEVPFITAKLQSDYLTINDIIKEETKKEPASKTVKAKKSGKVFSSDPLPFEVLKSINGNVDLSIKEFEFKKQTFSNIKMNAVMNAGKINVTPITMNVDEGTLNGSLFIDAKKNPPMVKLDATTKEINLGDLLEKLEADDNLKNGILNSKIAVEGRGNSVAKIMKNLSGSMTLFFQDGQYVVKQKLSKALQTFVKVLVGGERKGVVSLNCSIAKFDINRGIADTKTFVLDTNGAFVTGKGTVDLGREKLDLVMEPTAKELGLADLVSAMKVGGTLASPSVYPDPLAITKNVAKLGFGVVTGAGILGLVGVEVAEELGFGEDNPCADILKKQASQKKTNDDENKEKITDKIGNKTKDIGNKVKGLFDF